MSMSAYESIKKWVKAGEFSGWYPIYISPPLNIPLLIHIEDSGSAIGILIDDFTFKCTLPEKNSEFKLEFNLNSVTHWCVIPELIHEK